WQQDSNYTTLQASYMQVPPLPRQVLQTAQQWTRGARNAYEALHLLEAHLSDATQFTYSQDNPTIPTNVDAISWLLQTHRGYCTYSYRTSNTTKGYASSEEQNYISFAALRFRKWKYYQYKWG